LRGNSDDGPLWHGWLLSSVNLPVRGAKGDIQPLFNAPAVRYHQKERAWSRTETFMAQKIILVSDPGIDTAFAITLALFDANLEVLGVASTPGNVSAEQATRNVQVIVEQLDPPRWPRLGAAPPVEYDIDGKRLHGTNGLGGVDFPCAQLHHPHPSDKLIVDLVRQNPKEITVVVLGPLTALARAMDRDPELPGLVERLVCVGGAINEPGNAGPVTEFHFACDPEAARQVLRCGAPITLIPLDVMRKVLLSPTDLLNLPAPESRPCKFLRQIVPYALGATSQLYGIEGFHLKDVVGVAAVALRNAVSTKPMAVDVETRGQLTRGMTVVDNRSEARPKPNVDVAVGLDTAAVGAYLRDVLGAG
jgi:inosine-uridine nucleoside N-ribohydrolase